MKFFFLAFIISTITLVCIVLLNSNHRFLILICIIIALSSTGLGTATYFVNFMDIGAKYASFLMGFSNFFSSISGVIVPLLTARFVKDQTVRKEKKRFEFYTNIFIDHTIQNGMMDYWKVRIFTRSDHNLCVIFHYAMLLSSDPPVRLIEFH